jgi:hypothetical protein
MTEPESGSAEGDAALGPGLPEIWEFPHKKSRTRFTFNLLTAIALIAGLCVGTFFLTFSAGKVIKDFWLSLDGPTVVAQQTAYPESQFITKDDLNQKYHIYLLTQRQATGRDDAAGRDHDWTEAELHTLDLNLANTPALLYAKIGGARLSLFIGSLVGVGGDVPGGICGQECGGLYDGSFFFGGGLLGLDQRYYDLGPPAFDQTIIDHELTHRRYPLIAAGFEPALQSILGSKAYLALPEFSAAALTVRPERAVLALASLAEVDSDDPHINFEEGIAETSEIYTQGYRTFMLAYGPELNGQGDESYLTPVSSKWLAAQFPQADALYRLWQDQIFDGYGYDQQGSLVAGTAAIPPQQALPTPNSP